MLNKGFNSGLDKYQCSKAAMDVSNAQDILQLFTICKIFTVLIKLNFYVNLSMISVLWNKPTTSPVCYDLSCFVC